MDIQEMTDALFLQIDKLKSDREALLKCAKYYAQNDWSSSGPQQALEALRAIGEIE